MANDDLEYVGFWLRVWASVIDTVLILMVMYPLLVAVYGWAYFGSDKLIQGPADVLISIVLPAAAIVWFWLKRGSTPGKDAISAKIVDAISGGPPTFGQSVIRYLGYYVSAIPFGLGLIWVAFDPRKQGWHDKLAGTVVVRRRRGAASVVFPTPQPSVPDQTSRPIN
ncbi:MAG: RDD family protein [Casimicrobium sp.]